ncbi:hypothetical protein CDIK_2613 [Cucumispora dikerogammari]|nr:hypothetical protein CDIK_2613 [Cucumispora dikerogammari]
MNTLTLLKPLYSATNDIEEHCLTNISLKLHNITINKFSDSQYSFRFELMLSKSSVENEKLPFETDIDLNMCNIRINLHKILIEDGITKVDLFPESSVEIKCQPRQDALSTDSDNSDSIRADSYVVIETPHVTICNSTTDLEKLLSSELCLKFIIGVPINNNKTGDFSDAKSKRSFFLFPSNIKSAYNKNNQSIDEISVFLEELAQVLDSAKKLEIKAKNFANNQSLIGPIEPKTLLNREIEAILKNKEKLEEMKLKARQLYIGKLSKNTIEDLKKKLPSIKEELNNLESIFNELYPFSDRKNYFILQSEYYYISKSAIVSSFSKQDNNNCLKKEPESENDISTEGLNKQQNIETFCSENVEEKTKIAKHSSKTLGTCDVPAVPCYVPCKEIDSIVRCSMPDVNTADKELHLDCDVENVSNKRSTLLHENKRRKRGLFTKSNMKKSRGAWCFGSCLG